MFRIFSGKSREDEQSQNDRYSRSTTQGAKPGRTINYDPALINALKKDHHELVDVFQRIWSEGYEKRDFRQLAQLLTVFKSNFQAHLIKENVRFYVYLEQALAEDVHTLQIVKDFRTDMNDIANAVVQFCKRYTHEAFSQEMIRDFKRDYEKIGEALVRRVTLEEKELYTLYQPS
ncbi:hemerythrin domain-containing protein [Microbulbifer yueqingensis]|uniref:Hemerythrin HHE cation binding domain-containing protein n=1 Tax=Microbulbifer yueqingensis TaxID=658219 RepID=A0A1G8VCJ8_9GAMM|nr:hemerythrin domain-containing protein [Microbulbifer yueqingensis]SDJ63654.1 Hemerythrin HHE cation binding domain-containing protein [Microbulbifer yueqingensis]